MGLLVLMNFAHIVNTPSVPRIVPDDPDDDQIIAAAVAGKADAIITGDSHLLDLVETSNIPILRVKDLLDRYP